MKNRILYSIGLGLSAVSTAVTAVPLEAFAATEDWDVKKEGNEESISKVEAAEITDAVGKLNDDGYTENQTITEDGEKRTEYVSEKTDLTYEEAEKIKNELPSNIEGAEIVEAGKTAIDSETYDNEDDAKKRVDELTNDKNYDDASYEKVHNSDKDIVTNVDETKDTEEEAKKRVAELKGDGFDDADYTKVHNSDKDSFEEVKSDTLDDKDEASAKKAEFENNGYYNVVIETLDTTTPVSTKRFETKEEAERFIEANYKDKGYINIVIKSVEDTDDDAVVEPERFGTLADATAKADELKNAKDADGNYIYKNVTVTPVRNEEKDTFTWSVEWSREIPENWDALTDDEKAAHTRTATDENGNIIYIYSGYADWTTEKPAGWDSLDDDLKASRTKVVDGKIVYNYSDFEDWTTEKPEGFDDLDDDLKASRTKTIDGKVVYKYSDYAEWTTEKPEGFDDLDEDLKAIRTKIVDGKIVYNYGNFDNWSTEKPEGWDNLDDDLKASRTKVVDGKVVYDYSDFAAWTTVKPEGWDDLDDDLKASRTKVVDGKVVYDYSDFAAWSTEKPANWDSLDDDQKLSRTKVVDGKVVYSYSDFTAWSTEKPANWDDLDEDQKEARTKTVDGKIVYSYDEFTEWSTVKSADWDNLDDDQKETRVAKDASGKILYDYGIFGAWSTEKPANWDDLDEDQKAFRVSKDKDGNIIYNYGAYSDWSTVKPANWDDLDEDQKIERTAVDKNGNIVYKYLDWSDWSSVKPEDFDDYSDGNKEVRTTVKFGEFTDWKSFDDSDWRALDKFGVKVINVWDETNIQKLIAMGVLERVNLETGVTARVDLSKFDFSELGTGDNKLDPVVDIGKFGIITKDLHINNDFESNFLVFGDVTNGDGNGMHTIGSTFDPNSDNDFARDEAGLCRDMWYTGDYKGGIDSNTEKPNLHTPTDTITDIDSGSDLAKKNDAAFELVCDAFEDAVKNYHEVTVSVKEYIDNGFNDIGKIFNVITNGFEKVRVNVVDDRTEEDKNNAKYSVFNLIGNVSGDGKGSYTVDGNATRCGKKDIQPHDFVWDFSSVTDSLKVVLGGFSGVVYAPNVDVEARYTSEGQVISKSFENTNGEWHAVSCGWEGNTEYRYRDKTEVTEYRVKDREEVKEYATRDKSEVNEYATRDKTETLEYRVRDKAEVTEYRTRDKAETTEYTVRDKSEVIEFTTRNKTEVKEYATRDREEVKEYAVRDKAEVKEYTTRDKSEVKEYTVRDKSEVKEYQTPTPVFGQDYIVEAVKKGIDWTVDASKENYIVKGDKLVEGFDYVVKGSKLTEVYDFVVDANKVDFKIVGEQVTKLFKVVGLKKLPPSTPEVPEIPEIPDVPDVPDTPVTPDIPNTPETPDVPEDPDDPGTPGTVTIIDNEVPLAGEVLGAKRAQGDVLGAKRGRGDVLGARRAPGTADANNVMGWLASFNMSGAVLVAWFASRKKRDE